MNITESLPSWPSKWCMPRSEPSASPSGPSWAVSRKRSRERSSATTCSMADAATASVMLVLEQPRDPHALFDGVVVAEREGRGALHPRLGRDLRLQDAMRRAQASECRLALLLGAEHADVHLGGTKVWAGLHGCHGHE